MKINIFSNFGFTAFLSIIKDGKDKVVTAIINARILPKLAPLNNSASATGIVPNISAYIGTPSTVARITPNGFLLPNIFIIHYE